MWSLQWFLSSMVSSIEFTNLLQLFIFLVCYRRYVCRSNKIDRVEWHKRVCWTIAEIGWWSCCRHHCKLSQRKKEVCSTESNIDDKENHNSGRIKERNIWRIFLRRSFCRKRTYPISTRWFLDESLFVLPKSDKIGAHIGGCQTRRLWTSVKWFWLKHQSPKCQ